MYMQSNTAQHQDKQTIEQHPQHCTKITIIMRVWCPLEQWEGTLKSDHLPLELLQ